MSDLSDRALQQLIDVVMVEWMTRLREIWRADFAEVIQPTGLLRGAVTPGAMPPGTMISRGNYDPSGNYRKGDVIFSGGQFYVAIAAGTGNDPSDTAFWSPIGMGVHDIQGPLHSASGLTAGQVLTALTATTFAFAPRVHWIPLTDGLEEDPGFVFDDFGDVLLVEVTE